MMNLCYLEFAHREAKNPGYPSLEECVRGARELLSISHNPKPKKIYIKTLTGEDIMLAKTVIPAVVRVICPTDYLPLWFMYN
jgi:hypothetical protein